MFGGTAGYPVKVKSRRCRPTSDSDSDDHSDTPSTVALSISVEPRHPRTTTRCPPSDTGSTSAHSARVALKWTRESNDISCELPSSKKIKVRNRASVRTEIGSAADPSPRRVSRETRVVPTPTLAYTSRRVGGGIATRTGTGAEASGTPQTLHWVVARLPHWVRAPLPTRSNQKPSVPILGTIPVPDNEVTFRIPLRKSGPYPTLSLAPSPHSTDAWMRPDAPSLDRY